MNDPKAQAVCREVERMTGQTPVGLGDYLAIMSGHPNVRALVLDYLMNGERDDLLRALGGSQVNQWRDCTVWLFGEVS